MSKEAVQVVTEQEKPIMISFTALREMTHEERESFLKRFTNSHINIYLDSEAFDVTFSSIAAGENPLKCSLIGLTSQADDIAPQIRIYIYEDKYMEYLHHYWDLTTNTRADGKRSLVLPKGTVISTVALPLEVSSVIPKSHAFFLFQGISLPKPL